MLLVIALSLITSIEQPDSLNMRLAGGWSFGPLVVAVELDQARNILFSGAAGGIYIWDVSDPSNPVKIDEISTFGFVYDLFYDSARNAFFVADYNGGLEIWDVSDPANATFISRCYTSGTPMGVFVRGNYAYVADGNFSIIDISDLSSPHVAGELSTVGQTEKVFVSGNYAYLAGGSMKIVDISDPNNPRQIGQFFASGPSRDVEVVDTIAYVANDNGGFSVVNVSNPVYPEAVAQIILNGAANGLDVVGNMAIVTTDSGFSIIDISNPGAPLVRSAYLLPEPASGVVATDSLLFITDGEPFYFHQSSVYAFDISQPLLPTELWHYGSPDVPHSVFAHGNYAYLTTRTTGLYILDVSDPAHVHTIAHYDDDLQDSKGIYVDGNYAYVADGTSLKIIDVSDPFNPHEVSSLTSPGGYVDDVVVSGNTAVTAGFYFLVVDVADRTNPHWVIRGHLLSQTISVGIYDHYGYAVCSAPGSGVFVFDLSNIPDTTEFWPIDSWDYNNYIYSGTVSDSLVAVATYYDGVKLLTDPLNIHEIGSIAPPSVAYHAVVEGNMLFMATEDGLFAYDITDISNPVQSGYYTGTPYGLDRVFVAGSRVFAVDEYSGIKIFDYRPPEISEQPIADVGHCAEAILVQGRPAVRFELPRIEPVTLSVFDASGRKVWGKSFYPERTFITVELPADLNSGVYVVEVKSAHLTSNSKLIVVK